MHKSLFFSAMQGNSYIWTKRVRMEDRETQQKERNTKQRKKKKQQTTPKRQLSQISQDLYNFLKIQQIK